MASYKGPHWYSDKSILEHQVPIKPVNCCEKSVCPRGFDDPAPSGKITGKDISP
jgi:hypothetical protein